MATPHHLPALPTAAPILVEADAGALLAGEAEHDFLQRARACVANGQRHLQLVVPEGHRQRHLALATAISLAGPVLVVTDRDSTRDRWRRRFDRLSRQTRTVELDRSPRQRLLATTLTAITCWQLQTLLTPTDSPSPMLSEPPLKGLSVLILDSRRLRALDIEAIDRLLQRNATSAPVVLVLSRDAAPPIVARAARDRRSTATRPIGRTHPSQWPGLEPASAPDEAHVAHAAICCAHPILLEPSLLVREGRMAPFQELDWLTTVSAPSRRRIERRLDAAHAVIERTLDDAPLSDIERKPRTPLGRRSSVPGLRRFVESHLPHALAAGSSARSAWLRAIDLDREFSLALQRVHLALGGSLSPSLTLLLRPFVELHDADTDDDAYARVLARYLAWLPTQYGDEPPVRLRCRLVRDALTRLGYEVPREGLRAAPVATRVSRPAADPGGLLPLLEVERTRRAGELRAVLVHDATDEHTALRAARLLSQRGVSCAAIVSSGLWVSPECATRVLEEVARPLAAELNLRAELDVERSLIRVPSVSGSPRTSAADQAGMALFRGHVELVLCSRRRLHQMVALQPTLGAVVGAVIDLRTRLEGLPLPVLAAPLLRTTAAPTRLVNLWRVHGLGPGTSAQWAIAARIDVDASVGSMSDDGRIQYGSSRLRELVTVLTRAPVETLPAHIDAFNRQSLRQADKEHLLLERWRAIGATTRRRLAVEVSFEHGGLQPREPSELQPGQGAPMSERRARHRLHGFIVERRRVLAQVLVAAVLSGLLLPTLAGPILGSLVAIGCIVWMCAVARRQLWRNRLRSLYRPASTATTVRDIACVVLRALRSCEGIPQRDLPTASIRCSPTGQRRICIWLEHDNPRIEHHFVEALQQALQPVGNDRYIIGRPQTWMPTTRQQMRNALQLHVANYHPVPRHFAERREHAEIYAGHWAQVFGPGKLRYTTQGKGRLLRYAHYARNHLGLHVRQVVTM